jgi:hypothetical protein
VPEEIEIDTDKLHQHHRFRGLRAHCSICQNNQLAQALDASNAELRAHESDAVFAWYKTGISALFGV